MLSPFMAYLANVIKGLNIVIVHVKPFVARLTIGYGA